MYMDLSLLTFNGIKPEATLRTQGHRHTRLISCSNDIAAFIAAGAKLSADCDFLTCTFLRKTCVWKQIITANNNNKIQNKTIMQQATTNTRAHRSHPVIYKRMPVETPKHLVLYPHPISSMPQKYSKNYLTEH